MMPERTIRLRLILWPAVVVVLFTAASMMELWSRLRAGFVLIIIPLPFTQHELDVTMWGHTPAIGISVLWQNVAAHTETRLLALSLPPCVFAAAGGLAAMASGVLLLGWWSMRRANAI